MRISDISLPSSLTIDYHSRLNLLMGRYNNAFCGVVSVYEWRMYVVPYVPTLDGTVFPRPALIKVAGHKIAPIVHQGSDGLPGHEQLTSFLKQHCYRLRSASFIGFSILFSHMKGGFGGTSRSQNNQHFREWLFGNKDTAYKMVRRQHSYYRAGHYGPATFHEVTKPGSGILPTDWQFFLKTFVLTEVLHRDSMIPTAEDRVDGLGESDDISLDVIEMLC